LPEQVLGFFAKYNQDKGPNLGRQLQGVLRSFLRFSFRNGYLKRDLAEAIPPMRTYKLSGVPRGVSEEEARKTLESVDLSKPAGLRDFAILQLLDTYGVRGGQVRALQLQDIQWKKSRIRFSPHKGGKEIIAPLTVEVGESLLEYLRHGRPQAPHPEVFLTAQPPFQPLRSPATVSAMVAKHLRRAGVSKPKACSHAFRHGFATRMLRHGQSLKTIADLLGHRNINTTFIYAKVDLGTLRQLPLDWPEVGS
jgi:site-specific recombinase XerD